MIVDVSGSLVVGLLVLPKGIKYQLSGQTMDNGGSSDLAEQMSICAESGE